MTIQPESLCFRALSVIMPDGMNLFHYQSDKNKAKGVLFMDTKKLIPIISMVSVLVMFLWGYLANDWSRSWLAVFAGGIIIAIISILGRDKGKKDGE